MSDLSSISKERLVKALKIIYKIWNKEYESEWPSQSDVSWEGKIYKFFDKKIARTIGLENGVDDYYFWINSLILNEDALDNETLTPENVIYPQKNTFKIDTSELRTDTTRYNYSDVVDGYFTNEQLDQSFYELGQGISFDMYDFDNVDRDVIDSEGTEGIELDNIRIIDSTSSVSETNLDRFINSLNEGELKFLQTKLQNKLL